MRPGNTVRTTRTKSAVVTLPRSPQRISTIGGRGANGNSPGEGSALSQNLDYAALYFVEEAGRGGYGGYLASDSGDDSELLNSAAEKIRGRRAASLPAPTASRSKPSKVSKCLPHNPSSSPAANSPPSPSPSRKTPPQARSSHGDSCISRPPRTPETPPTPRIRIRTG